MPDVQWHYTKGSESNQTGPVGEAEFARLIASGEVGPHTLVWREGFPKWIPAAEAFSLPPQVPLAARNSRAFKVLFGCPALVLLVVGVGLLGWYGVRQEAPEEARIIAANHITVDPGPGSKAELPGSTPGADLRPNQQEAEAPIISGPLQAHIISGPPPEKKQYTYKDPETGEEHSVPTEDAFLLSNTNYNLQEEFLPLFKYESDLVALTNEAQERYEHFAQSETESQRVAGNWMMRFINRASPDKVRSAEVQFVPAHPSSRWNGKSGKGVALHVMILEVSKDCGVASTFGRTCVHIKVIETGLMAEDFWVGNNELVRSDGEAAVFK